MIATLRYSFRVRSPLLAAASLSLLAALPLRARAAQEEPGPVVLVVYHSLTGNTEAMAEAAAEGAQEVAGVTVELLSIADATAADLERAEGIVVASPTHWANLPTAVAEFVNGWPFLGGKVAGAIATAGNPGGGSELVLQSLIGALLNHGAMILGPVFEEGEFRFGTMGATALTGPVGPGVNDAELDGARRLGRRVAEVVLRGRDGAR
jgi:NAD(P)H dehydrogenase (quinone)